MKTPKPKYEIHLRDKDLRRDVFRAGGPGGQHQNKTESAVRYTHIPTGVCAESRSDRSQHANTEIALQALKDRLIALWLIQKTKGARDAYRAKPEAAFGVKMRSYVLHGHRRVTDHETRWEGDPRKVLEGDIDDLLRSRMIDRYRMEKGKIPA